MSLSPAGTGQPVVAFDVSALLAQRVTGIQRVILELVPRLSAACFQRGYDIALVHSLDWELRRLACWNEPLSTETIVAQLRQLSADGQVTGSGDSFWRRVRAVGQQFGLLRAKEWLRQFRGVRLFQEWLRAPLRRLGRATVAADYYIGFAAGILPIRVPVGIDPKHVLLIAHDLIPLLYPEYIAPDVTRSFEANMSALLRHADAATGWHWFTPTEHIAEQMALFLRSYSRQQVPVQAAYWGYNRALFYPDPAPTLRRELGIPEDAFLILAVSTQEPRKRFHVIEQAVQIVASFLPLSAVIVGFGPTRELVKGRVQYLGYLTDEQLRRCYSSCDVYVNWSAAEGFGLPVLEALACGARVLLPPDNPALFEVADGKAMIADDASAAGLATALTRMHAARHAPSHIPIAARYDWEHCAQRLLHALMPEQMALPQPLAA